MTIRSTASQTRGTATGVVLLLAVLVGCVPPVLAGTALDSRYGSPVTMLLPEISGMGGTGTALYRGGVSNVFNPAFLVWEEGMRLDAATSLEQAHEDRFLSLFDTFDSYVTDTAIASNRHHYFGSGFGFAKRVRGANAPLVVAVSLTDRYGFAYDFVEEVRDPSPFLPIGERDRLLENRVLEVNGTLRALSGGAAIGLSEYVSLGAAVHYAFGTRQETRSQRFYEDPAGNNLTESSLDLDGVNFTLGTRFRLDERIELGLAYETPLLVTGNLLTDLYTGAALDTVSHTRKHVSIYYPRRYRAGFSYRPRSEPRTIFNVDAVWTEWTELEDSRVPGDDNPQHLEDTLDVRAGVEHIFYNGFAARFGFRHLDSYADREAGMSAFTAGVGMPVGAGMISTSVELSKINSRQEHWFEYPNIVIDGNQYVAFDESRVEDTRFRFGFGYTRSF